MAKVEQGRATALHVAAVELEAFGLSGNEACVLLGLLQVGSGDTATLTRLCGITRTNVYRLLESLVAKGLVERLPSKRVATWTSLGREETLARLYRAQEDRVRELQARAARLNGILAAALPDVAPAPMAHVQLLHTAAETARVYKRLLEQARVEIVVLHHPPYAWKEWAFGMLERSPWVGPLERGVAVRTLYEPSSFEGPWVKRARQELDASVAAGEQARVGTEPAPLKLSVFDRQICLLAMPDEAASDDDFPVTMLVDHAGFAELQISAFDLLWNAARRYQDLPPPAVT